MEFFRNLTAVNLVKPEERPTSGSATAVNITKPTGTVKPPQIVTIKPDPIAQPVPIPEPLRPSSPNENGSPVYEKRSTEEGYYGGGGLSFGAEEEDVPETTEVVQNKSNVGKTMLVLAAVGLGLWLLSGGKKVKVK